MFRFDAGRTGDTVVAGGGISDVSLAKNDGGH